MSVCDVAITNHYYMGKMATATKKPERKWAEAVRVVFTDQDGRGQHLNLWCGRFKECQNRDNAIKMLEFLVSEKAQKTRSGQF